MADRHNTCINPCLTNDNTGWTSNATAPTRTDVTGLGFGRQFAARYTDGSVAFSPAGAASAGLDYTVSVYVRPHSFTISGSIFIEFLDAGSGSLGFSSAGFTASNGTVTRISVTATAPTSTAFVRFVITGENFGTNTTDFTQALFEQASTLESYFDGDSPSGSWDGAAGNSPSTLSSGSAVTGDVSQTITGTVTATGANAAAGTASQTLTAALTAAGANAAVGAAAQTVTGSVTASGTNAASGGAASTTTAGVTASGVNAAAGAASSTASASVTASAVVTGTEALPTVTVAITVEASVISPSSGGGWYGLLDILREAAEERRVERERVPVACPNDGEPLRAGPNGELHCTFDGFIYQG
ncbi:hypothetical protein ABZ912_19970 [Nonomuraea angiospora]|uniref:hypothetical protein n=1 Tax=Nonomuraea angiospora TaxID=46172 RepID=UPI0033FE3005